MDLFDEGDFRWSSGNSDNGKDAFSEEEAAGAFDDDALTTSQTAREWQRMARAIARALECLNASDPEACALLLAIARDTARENATLTEAESYDIALSAEERRRLQDGMEA